MKKYLFLLTSLIFLAFSSYAQDNKKAERPDMKLPFNGYNLSLPEGKVHFTNTQQKMIIKFKDGLSQEKIVQILRKIPGIGTFDKTWIVPFPKLIRAELTLSGTLSYERVASDLEKNPNVLYTAPVLLYRYLQEQSLYDLFYVKIKTADDLSLLRQYAAQFNFKIEKEYEKNIYFCRVDKKSAGNSFEIAAYLQSLNLFEYAEPDFIYTCLPGTTDPSYNLQWAIKNTGQYSGIPGSDMNIENAWTITTGVSSIKVAIIDCFGSVAQFTHPDISFFATYDATGTGFNSSGFTGDAHGICCAGIVKATANNSLGGAGVAYNANVIAVKVGTIINNSGNWNSTGNSISDGITWAYQNADVTSNSNSLGSSSSLINTAIANGLSLGRAGKGSLFFSSAGNSNSTSIGYPASNANTVAVAASSPCDQRKSTTSCDGETWWGSDYGTGVDVAAPGVKIYTTDLPGSAGYSSTDFTATFNGTSSACPMAAAVMALILSADPNLTAANARQIMESTCSKVGGYTYNSSVSGQPNGTWSTELGYGRVNAFAALQAVGGPCAGTPGVTITGSSSVCANTSFTLSLSNLTSGGTGITYLWESSITGTSGWGSAGSVNSSLSVSGISSPMFYRLVATCANSSQQGISNVIAITINPANQCYCIPSVTTQDELITNVTVAGINNPNTGFGTNGYQDFTNLTGTMQQGSTYSFSAGIAPHYSLDDLAVWIDLNQDGVFDNPGERLLLNAPTATPSTGNITIPSNAITGLTRMRVRLDYNNTNPTPCGNSQYGNIEDYSVNITSACPSASVVISTALTSVCQNTAVNFTAALQNGGPAPSYQWNINGAPVGGATGSSFNTSFSNSSTVSLTMTPSLACQGGTPVQSNTISMSVTPSVTPTISINTPATNIIAGTSVTFTATISNGGNSPQYQWKVNGVNAGNNNPVFTTNSLANGNAVTCILTSNALCAMPVSVTSNSISMVVCTASNWYADADADGYGNPNVSLSSCTQPPGYVLNDDDCNDNNNSIHPGATEVCGNNTDDDCDGLVDETCCPACTKAPKKPAILFSGTSLTSGVAAKYCSGDLVTASVSIPDPLACSYIWAVPAGASIISGQGTVSITILLDSNFIASSNVSVYAQNPCGQSLAAVKLLTKGSNIYKAGTITQYEASKICPDESRQFTIHPVNTITNYLWTPPVGGTITAGQGTTSIDVYFGTGFIATSPVKVKVENACGWSVDVKLNAAISSKPATPAAITGSISGMCNVNNMVYSTVDVPDLEYNWSFNNAEATVSSGQGTSTISADFSNLFTTGILSVTAANGCGVSAAKKTATIKAIPAVPVSVTGPSAACFQQSGVAYSTPAMPGTTSYTWTAPNGATISDGVITSPGNSLSTGSNAVTVHFGNAGGTVKVAAVNSCGSSNLKSMPVTVTNCTPLRSVTGEPSIQLFPNPAKNILNMVFDSPEEMKYQVKVYDALGKEVLKLAFHAMKGNNQEQLNISKLSSGIYQLIIASEELNPDLIGHKARFLVE